MKNRILVVSFLITLATMVGCKSDQEKMIDRITELESIDTGASHQKELAGLYDNYLSKYETDSATGIQYAQDAAKYYSIFEEYDQSNHMLDMLRDMMGDSAYFTSEYAVLKGDNYRNAKKPDSAVIAYEAITNYKNLNPQTSIHLVMCYQDYASQIVNENAKGELLVKAANLLQASGNQHEALAQYTDFYKKYPESEYTTYAMMRSVDLLENQFKDLDSARSILETIVEKYPEDHFADEAKIYLENDLLGKTDLEKLEIVRKNGQY